MDRIVSPGRVAWVLAAAALHVCAARAAVVIPLPQHRELQGVADRVHALAVQVRARAFIADHEDGGLRVQEAVSSTSGVLIGDGLAVTGLSSVALRGRDGALVPANAIEVVVDDVGPLPARLVAGDTDLDLAVLQLPDEARSLSGAVLAADDPSAGDTVLAMAVDGDSIRVVAVLLESAGPMEEAKLHMDRALPPPFTGGPLFDGRGHLAGISTRSADASEIAVPASLVRALLRKLRSPAGT